MAVSIFEFFPTLFQNRFSGSFANAALAHFVEDLVDCNENYANIQEITSLIIVSKVQQFQQISSF